MVLYIVRHGEAVEVQDGVAEEWRYLTEKGARSVGRLASKIARYDRKPRLVISSPLVRAVQTAQIAAAEACRKSRTIVSGLLLPEGDFAELKALLVDHAAAKRVMIVGHEPHLGSFLGHLLQRKEALQLKKGSCVALEIDPEDMEKPARFKWSLLPGCKPVTSLAKAFPLGK